MTYSTITSMGYKTYDCSVARRCGGCEWLAVPYPIQLKRKQQDIDELFSEFDCQSPQPIIGMDEPKRCRNKIIVKFVSAKGGAIRYGLYAKGTHNVISREDCIVEDTKAKPILDTIARLAKSFKLRPFNEETGEGFLRYALLRVAKHTNEVLVCLVCSKDTLPGSKAFIKQLRAKHPEVTTVVLNVNSRNTNVILGEKEHVLFGRGFIEDKLCGCRFRISATSFYQVNPIQTEVLYNAAIDMAGLNGTETILDAYCGTGTIGIIASKRAGKLIGVEVNKQAIRDAKANARRNGIDNATFIAADAGQFMREQAALGQKVDVVFMDPPRSGSDEEFLASLCSISPKNVVYISCNPKTQVRDVQYLIDHGYAIDRIQPVDMFPHTKHVETVVLMSRKAFQ